MAQTSNPKGRNLIAVIGDEVRDNYHVLGKRIDGLGFSHWTITSWDWTCGQSAKEELLDR